MFTMSEIREAHLSVTGHPKRVARRVIELHRTGLGDAEVYIINPDSATVIWRGPASSLPGILMTAGKQMQRFC